MDVVTGVLKANFPCRLAYKTASAADSRTIIDGSGAEKLLGRGDALYLAADGWLQRVHGAYLPGSEIAAMLEPYRGEVQPLPQISTQSSKTETAPPQVFGLFQKYVEFLGFPAAKRNKAYHERAKLFIRPGDRK